MPPRQSKEPHEHLSEIWFCPQGRRQEKICVGTWTQSGKQKGTIALENGTNHLISIPWASEFLPQTELLHLINLSLEQSNNLKRLSLWEAKEHINYRVKNIFQCWHGKILCKRLLRYLKSKFSEQGSASMVFPANWVYLTCWLLIEDGWLQGWREQNAEVGREELAWALCSFSNVWGGQAWGLAALGLVFPVLFWSFPVGWSFRVTLLETFKLQVDWSQGDKRSLWVRFSVSEKHPWGRVLRESAKVRVRQRNKMF